MLEIIARGAKDRFEGAESIEPMRIDEPLFEGYDLSVTAYFKGTPRAFPLGNTGA